MSPPYVPRRFKLYNSRRPRQPSTSHRQVMKTKLQLLLSKTALQRISIATTWLLISVIVAVNANATLPAIPKGVAVLNTNDKAIKQAGILNNPDVDMISI